MLRVLCVSESILTFSSLTFPTGKSHYHNLESAPALSRPVPTISTTLWLSAQPQSTLLPHLPYCKAFHPVSDAVVLCTDLRLPIQTPQGLIHNQDLPPKHQRQRIHLSRYPEGPMVSCIDYIERCVFEATHIFTHPRPRCDLPQSRTNPPYTAYSLVPTLS